MRIIFAYTLLFALTLQSFYRCVMTIEYQLHLPEYLAKCINQDRPELHCNGQCVLMQKIKEKEQKETKKNLLVYEYSALYMHRESTTFDWCAQQEENTAQHETPYLSGYVFQYATGLFRPPLAA